MGSNQRLAAGTAICFALALAACHPPQPPAGPDLPAVAAETYHPSLLMVRMAPGRSLRSTARAKGARLLEAPRASGYGLLEVPSGQAGSRFAALLRDDVDVRDVQPVAILHATGRKSRFGAHPLQWQVTATDPPIPGRCGEAVPSVVAILDTGVAYENHEGFVRAPTLDCSPITAPWDFVNDDAHPNDDNWHGTLMASLIASADEDLVGIATGVGIMPIKVLDADNLGLEIDLVDGIYHAVDNQADVISMSLTFGRGYTPSTALLEALQTAHDAGIVVVAAAGNDGDWASRWPAASPLTIAVAGARPGAWDEGPSVPWDGSTYSPAAYSNLHPMIDVVAPGGSFDADRTGSGYVDGVLAQGIHPNDPSNLGLWLSAGTSQATAVTSGAVAHLLAAGAAAHDVPLYLHTAASWDGLAGEPFVSGQGGGTLRIDALLALGTTPPAPALDLYGSVLPYMVRDGGALRPVAEVTVVDATGTPFSEGSAVVTFSGSTVTSEACALVDGRCRVLGAPLDPGDMAQGAAWMATLDAVRVGSVGYRPSGLMFASDAFEILLASLLDASAGPSLPAFYWEDVADPAYGAVAHGYTVVDSGAGFASSPIGLTFTPDAFGDALTTQDLSVDLDASGLASSPIGFGLVRIVHIDGAGLASSPLGAAGFASSPIGLIDDVVLASFEGTGMASSPMTGAGLASSPIGLSALDVYSFGDTSYDSAWLGFEQDAVLLATGTSPTGTLASTHLGDQIGQGGWVQDGYQGASLLGMGATDHETEPSAALGPLPLDGGAP